jgi:hypothetical protein
VIDLEGERIAELRRGLTGEAIERRALDAALFHPWFVRRRAAAIPGHITSAEALGHATVDDLTGRLIAAALNCTPHDLAYANPRESGTTRAREMDTQRARLRALLCETRANVKRSRRGQGGAKRRSINRFPPR